MTIGGHFIGVCRVEVELAEGKGLYSPVLPALGWLYRLL